MRQKFKPWAKQYLIDNKKFFVEFDEETKYDWKKIFGNDKPIDIEIGMGKGTFTVEMAKTNPDVNYVGIEMYPSVQVNGLQKVEDTDMDNIKFMSMDAMQLDKVFENGSIRNVYLNFSDPWPKARHAKRRLTFKRFLDKYLNASNKGSLIFKTDNADLFEWSVESVEDFGLKVDWISRDLWNEDVFNIRTEYEEKFGNRGFKINKLIAKLDK